MVILDMGDIDTAAMAGRFGDVSKLPDPHCEGCDGPSGKIHILSPT